MIKRAIAALTLLAGTAQAGAAELVMFEAAGCGWCAQWHEEIGPAYPRTAEGRLAPLRQVDLHGPRPDDLKGIRGVVYTPTFVLLDQGREIGRINGYPGQDFFWGLLGELTSRLPASGVGHGS